MCIRDRVKEFLVQRYGEFVLYKPQVSAGTWLLWFGPGLLLLAGLGTVIYLVRKRGGGDAATVAHDDNQEW